MDTYVHVSGSLYMGTLVHTLRAYWTGAPDRAALQGQTCLLAPRTQADL